MSLAHAALASSLLLSLAQVNGCGGDPLPGPLDGGDDGGGGSLRWYATCGDPVCREGGHRDSGIAKCTTQKAGDACAKANEQCDPVNDCNAYLRCSDSDPTMQPGGCPISRASHKRDVAYLDEADKERMHRELLAIPLATYRYKADPSRRHLGFIIDDLQTPWPVAADGEHVDLYGYATMATAALQAQEKEIARLRLELESLKSEVAAMRYRRAPTRTRP